MIERPLPESPEFEDLPPVTMSYIFLFIYFLTD